MKTDKQHIVTTVWVNACRFLLAAAFLFSGFVKAVDPMGSFYKLNDYLAAFGMGDWFNENIILAGGILLSAFEFILGMLLLFGIYRRLSTLTTLLFMCAMTALTLYLVIKNPISDCGCFGDAWLLSNTETFVKNLILLAAAISICWKHQYIHNWVSVYLEWMVAICASVFVFGLSVYCYQHLPILDFRPYKVGAHFSADGMVLTVPKQSGKALTAKDTTYTDFYITDVTTGDDITLTVLNDTNYVFLLASHDITRADDSHIDRLNAIYDYTTTYGYKFYCMTDSPVEAIERWKDHTGAEYPFVEADQITLKTFIRSNPGLILLKAGTIIRKWSDKDIPGEAQLSAPLTTQKWGTLHVDSTWITTIKALIWLIIPLGCITLMGNLPLKRLFRREKPQNIEK